MRVQSMKADLTSSFKRCADCGVTRRILDLDSGPSARSDDSTLEYRKIETVRLAERMKEVGQLLEEQWNELLDGSGYATLNDLIRGIGNKSQGLVDGGNIPFYQLERWGPYDSNVPIDALGGLQAKPRLQQLRSGFFLHRLAHVGPHRRGQEQRTIDQPAVAVRTMPPGKDIPGSTRYLSLRSQSNMVWACHHLC